MCWQPATRTSVARGWDAVRFNLISMLILRRLHEIIAEEIGHTNTWILIIVQKRWKEDEPHGCRSSLDVGLVTTLFSNCRYLSNVAGNRVYIKGYLLQLQLDQVW